MQITNHVSNGVSTIEICRPEKKNALTLAMYESMTDAIRAAVADGKVRSILLTGQPGLFTAGNDLEEFAKNPPQGTDSPVFRFMKALSECEKPVLAAVTGTAIGIGVTLLLHCDFVYVAHEARLAMPFVSLGLTPEFGSSLLLPRLIGNVRASEKLLLGDPFTGDEAVALGIANEALAMGDVLSRTRKTAERFNALPPSAVRDGKKMMRRSLAQVLPETLAVESDLFLRRLQHPEAKEAFKAFFEKRKPNFDSFA